MKSLRTVPLKHFTAGLLALLFLILVGEYFVIKTKLHALENVEMKTDFVRSAQVSVQQLALKMQRYTAGQTDLNAELISYLDQQDQVYKTLAEGGRVNTSDSFLEPLSRLPKITFDNLYNHWKKYKENALVILTEPEEITNTINPVVVTDTIAEDSLAVDSLQHEPATFEKTINPQVARARTLLAGQWLTLTDWHEKLIADLKKEEGDKDSTLNRWFIFFVVADMVLLFSLFWAFNQFILKPIKELETGTAGKIQSKGFPENEIGLLAYQINDTIEQLKDAAEFVQKIGEGDLEINYRDLDSQYRVGKNKLADSLISMQSKLKALSEEEQKRKWSNEGLAKFVDILRSSNDNIHTLGDAIISALVQYTASNQGGLYILNDEDQNQKHLELISLFAFDSKKFGEQKVKLGEGILGQTFLEQKTTYLLEIPEDYVRITSGLGDASPNAILIVPLKVDTEVYGIVELASFKRYQPHEIAFVEKLGETIASTLAAVKSAQRNRHLIEQFQQQTEEMRAQEEEMRQNMEELQATQEEIVRKERNYIARIQQLENDLQENTGREAAQAQEEFARKEHTYHLSIQELKQKISEMSTGENDWELAREVGKTLKISLEALRITQQELERKTVKN